MESFIFNSIKFCSKRSSTGSIDVSWDGSQWKGFQRLYNKTFQLEISLFIIDLWIITRCLYTLDLPWTTIRNKSTKWRRRWLDSDECLQMIIHQAHSGKELCRHNHWRRWQLNRFTKQFSFNCEDDGERDGYHSTQDDMILSNSIVHLNIKWIAILV